jgi:hypothetical protein
MASVGFARRLIHLVRGIDDHRRTTMTADHCISQGYWFESSRRSFYQRKCSKCGSFVMIKLQLIPMIHMAT